MAIGLLIGLKLMMTKRMESEVIPLRLGMILEILAKSDLTRP